MERLICGIVLIVIVVLGALYVNDALTDHNVDIKRLEVEVERLRMDYAERAKLLDAAIAPRMPVWGVAMVIGMGGVLVIFGLYMMFLNIRYRNEIEFKQLPTRVDELRLLNYRERE